MLKANKAHTVIQKFLGSWKYLHFINAQGEN